MRVRSGEVTWLPMRPDDGTDEAASRGAQPPDRRASPATPSPGWVAELAARTGGRPHDEPVPATVTLRAAAVLVLLTDSPTGPRVLLTRRAPDLADYPEQLVFPGGGRPGRHVVPGGCRRRGHRPGNHRRPRIRTDDRSRARPAGHHAAPRPDRRSTRPVGARHGASTRPAVVGRSMRGSPQPRRPGAPASVPPCPGPTRHLRGRRSRSPRADSRCRPPIPTARLGPTEQLPARPRQEQLGGPPCTPS